MLYRISLGLTALGVMVAGSASAQRLGPDYSQRSLPGAGGGDTISGGSDLAGEENRPVACVYQYSHRVPRPDLVELIKNGYVAKTSKEKMAFQLIGETIAACRAGQGWGPKRQDAALRFFSGRVLADDALYQGRDLGLTGPVVRALAEKLDPATKAAYDAGHVDGTQATTALAQLKAAGLDTAPLAPEQRQKLALLIAQALWGIHVQAVAADAFKAG